METFSSLLAICAWKSPATCDFPEQRPVTRSFDVFFDLRLNKRLSKQWWSWRFETPSMTSLWCPFAKCYGSLACSSTLAFNLQVLFTIYTTPLRRIIQRHGLTYHLYADDTQLYVAFKPSDVTSKCDAITRIEACVADIRIWMNDNFLKLNDDKTELLIITTREELSKISDISIKVGDQSISPSDDPPRNLGVLFDSTCCLDAHVAKLCRSINFNLYSVGKIRKYLDGPTAEKMINATVTSRLDYCNSLLQNNPTSTDCSAARIMQPGLYLKGASLTLLALCWENCIGFPWSIGSVKKVCSSPTRHWMAMLHNISQH